MTPTGWRWASRLVLLIRRRLSAGMDGELEQGSWSRLGFFSGGSTASEIIVTRALEMLSLSQVTGMTLLRCGVLGLLGLFWIKLLTGLTVVPWLLLVMQIPLAGSFLAS